MGPRWVGAAMLVVVPGGAFYSPPSRRFVSHLCAELELNQLEPWLAITPMPACTLDLELKNGAVEPVKLRSIADVESEASRLRAKHPTSPRDTEKSLARTLAGHYKKFQAQSSLPAPYRGPSYSDTLSGGDITNLAASFEVGHTGLVLEVAQSLAGAGLGLFMRKRDASAPHVVLQAGQALCGYPCRVSARPMIEGGKTILFSLASLDDEVMFDAKLQPLRAVLEAAGPSVQLAGHVISWDSAVPTGVQLSDEADTAATGMIASADELLAGPCRYLVPYSGVDFTGGGDGRPPGIAGVGDQANDLAVEKSAKDGKLQVKGAKRGGDGGPYGGAEEYAAAAEKHDLLYFRYRLDLMHADQSTDSSTSNNGKPRGGRLVPGSAVLVARRAVMVDSTVPMELGHAYGWPYWQGQLSDQLRWG